jgi:hypothetical protein
MDCNCAKACSIPYCITELEIGIIEPDLTSLVVEFKDITTGRVKKLTGIAPQSDGLLIVDVATINAFFSPNFTYEIKVLFSDESECETVPIIIGDQTVECVAVNFISGVSTRGVFILDGQTSRHMQFSGDFTPSFSFVPTLTGEPLVISWGDGSENVIFSAISNSHTYAVPSIYDAHIRGNFSGMTAITTGNLGTRLTNVVLPVDNVLTNVTLRSNKLPTSVINNILYNLDQAGLTNGLLSLQNQSPAAPPTFQGLTSKDNLIAKGWSVTTD